VRRYPGPILIVHGEQDEVVGADNAVRLDRAARGVAGREVELLILPEGRHRWLYEDPAYRGRIAAFLARNLAGAAEPDRAAARAVAARVRRPPDTDGPLSALARPAAPAPAPLGRDGALSNGTLSDAALPAGAPDDPAGAHDDPNPIRS
jgi:dienelactone hydrolase